MIKILACFDTVPLPPSLAVYPLDKKRGGIDITGRNPSARFKGTVFDDGPDGRKQGSTKLSGNGNSYVLIPNTGKLDPRYTITVLIWVYPVRSTGIVLTYNPSRTGFQLRIISPRKLLLEMVERTRRTTIRVSTPRPVIERKIWNYIGVTYSKKSKTVTFWVNAKAIATTVIGKVELDTRRSIRLGGYRGSRDFFKGLLSCLQVYSFELTSRQIEEAKKMCFLKGEMKSLSQLLESCGLVLDTFAFNMC